MNPSGPAAGLQMELGCLLGLNGGVGEDMGAWMFLFRVTGQPPFVFERYYREPLLYL